MRSVGQQLRQARQAQGRTLEELNSSTRISLKNLEAIEADQPTAISSAFLYKSFVKQFAESVGLDYGQLQEDVQTAASQMPAPLMPGEVVGSALKVPALPVRQKRTFRLLYSLSSFALVLVACSGIYSVWQNAKVRSAIAQRARPRNENSAAKPTTPDRLHAAAVKNPASAEAKPNTSTSSPGPDSRERVPESFTLELSATEPAWLSIVADGKQSFKGILERAETKILEGHNTARIRTGNAGGVKVVFNGKALGALGRRGQIRTVVFTTNDYEVVDRPARVAAVMFSQSAELKWPVQPLLLFPGL